VEDNNLIDDEDVSQRERKRDEQIDVVL